MNEQTFKILINGEHKEFNCAPNVPLLWVLRDILCLTGTKYGCGEGICGICTVLHGKESVRSCQIEIKNVTYPVTTIEGLANEHIVLRAWRDQDVPQCGFCQPGQIMCLASSVNNNESKEITLKKLNTILCRCGTYPRIHKALDQIFGRSEP